MLQTVLDLMSQGASKVEVAAELGITRETLYQWVCKYPEFSDTIKMGETLSQAWWERQARLGLGRSSINTALWFINMKNRFGWHNGARLSDDVSKEELKIATIVDLGGI